MSLLTIVSDATALCGLGTVSTAFGNSDLNVQQFVGFAQQEGDELSRFNDWRRLKTLYSINGDGVASTYALPADFDRLTAGDALWLSTKPALPLLGPITDSEMLALKNAVARTIRPVWRMLGDAIEFYPILSSGDIVNTTYYTKNWIVSSDGMTPRSRWVSDTDVTLLPERVMSLGLVWRWKKSKGFDYAEDFRTYQLERTRAASKDSGQGVIHQREVFGHIGRVSDVRVIP